MPQNPPEAKPSTGQQLSRTAARHIELVIFSLGLVTGVLITLVAGVLR